MMTRNFFRTALLPIAVALSVCISSIASDRTKSPQQQYIHKYSALAIEEMYRSGVPASITLAQGLLESRNGQSELAIKANNHFGIKCHNWNGESMYHDDDRKGECFRKYASVEQSFRDHSDFLRYRDRYKFLFDLEPGDYKGWAHGLKKAGYATDSSYPQKLIRLIEEYELHKYDVRNEEQRELPKSPAQMEQARPLSDKERETFHFALSRQMYSINGVPFIYSVDGESYASIAARYNLFHKEILRYNDLKKDETLYPGTIVYLQKKKKKAVPGIEKHIVEGSGEQLHDIAQRYALRMKNLCRMNGITENYIPREGEVIILR